MTGCAPATSWFSLDTFFHSACASASDRLFASCNWNPPPEGVAGAAAAAAGAVGASTSALLENQRLHLLWLWPASLATTVSPPCVCAPHPVLGALAELLAAGGGLGGALALAVCSVWAPHPLLGAGGGVLAAAATAPACVCAPHPVLGADGGFAGAEVGTAVSAGALAAACSEEE